MPAPGLAVQYAPLIETITRTYDDWITRLYCTIRFRIINTRILDGMLAPTRPQGELLVLGCGFGLFDLLVGLRWPDKPVRGIDIDEARIEQARRSARRLGLANNRFEVQDLSRGDAELGRCDEILMLDVLHHVPRDQHERLLRSCYEALRPGGTLILKDIHRGNPLKLAFTWLLDMLMTGGKPVAYRDEHELAADLAALGFAPVQRLRLNDVLPYPHMLYVCSRPGG